jgi:hypothetical protein
MRGHCKEWQPESVGTRAISASQPRTIQPAPVGAVQPRTFRFPRSVSIAARLATFALPPNRPPNGFDTVPSGNVPRTQAQRADRTTASRKKSAAPNEPIGCSGCSGTLCQPTLDRSDGWPLRVRFRTGKAIPAGFASGEAANPRPGPAHCCGLQPD